MQHDFFDGPDEAYHISSYFYRIEFQQRGAPHLHSLLWLKNQVGDEAPNFWSNAEEYGTEENLETSSNENEKIRKVEKFADFLISTSPDKMTCSKHKFSSGNEDDVLSCEDLGFRQDTSFC